MAWHETARQQHASCNGCGSMVMAWPQVVMACERRATLQPQQSNPTTCLRGNDQRELPEEVWVGVHEGSGRLLHVAPRHSLIQFLEALCASEQRAGSFVLQGMCVSWVVAHINGGMRPPAMPFPRSTRQRQDDRACLLLHCTCRSLGANPTPAASAPLTPRTRCSTGNNPACSPHSKHPGTPRHGTHRWRTARGCWPARRR